MDCSPPGPSVHGILQAGSLEWVATPSSRASFQPRDRPRVSYVSCVGRQVLYHRATGEARCLLKTSLLPPRHRGSPLPPENLLIPTGQRRCGCLVVSALAGKEELWGWPQWARPRLTISVCPPCLSPPQLCPQGLHVLQHHRLPRSGREGRPQASSQEESHRLVPVAPGAWAGREPEAESGQREHRGPAGEGSAGQGGGAATRSRQVCPSARPGSAGPDRPAPRPVWGQQAPTGPNKTETPCLRQSS